MKVAVTGAAGFVGSHLVESLLDSGHEVVALDRPDTKLPESVLGHDRLSLLQGDVRDGSQVSTARIGDCAMVFHLAAVVGVANYLSDPFDVIEVNVLGTRNVLKTARQTGARVVLASTSEIYGRNPRVPWAEEDDRVLGGTQVDRWSYSTSKAAAEHLALAAHKAFDLPVTVVRYFNAYGPRQAPNYVISKSVHRVLNGERPLLYDSGEQTRCFTYVSDIVAGTIRAGTAEGAIGEVINLGSTTETSIREAIEIVVKEAGSNLDVELFETEEAFGSRYEDIVRRVPDVAKAKSLLGWSADTSLRQGVRRTIEWAQAHPSWLNLEDTVASAPSMTSS